MTDSLQPGAVEDMAFLLRLPGLLPNDRILLAETYLRGSYGYARIRLNDIRQMSHRTARRSLNKLVSLGYVLIENMGKDRHGVYRDVCVAVLPRFKEG